MFKTHKAIWAVVLIAVGLPAFACLAAERKTPTKSFMRQKIGYAQGVLEGITLEKYNLVLTNAVGLRNMNLTNTFLVLKNPDYRGKIASFQSAVDELTKAAEEKSLNGSTEAYSHIVSSCIACHQSFRREQFNASLSK